MRITSVVQRYGNLVGFGELQTFKHLNKSFLVYFVHMHVPINLHWAFYCLSFPLTSHLKLDHINIDILLFIFLFKRIWLVPTIGYC